MDEYRRVVTNIVVPNPSSSATLTIIRDELNMGLDGLLDLDIPYVETDTISEGSVIVGTPASSSIIRSLNLEDTLDSLGDEGYIIKSVTIDGKKVTVIASKGEFGALYGTFGFLRLLQTQKSITNLDISDKPKVKIRKLDHWETERNYAGGNFINWNSLPDTLLPRYTTFARACASVGINAFVFNNVNASATYLTAEYIAKEKALADLFRPYGIKVYLSVPFNAPRSIATPSYPGVSSSPRLNTADPLDPQVIKWWNDMVDAIYSQIPDFGGFLIKAGSEGQSGPGDYGRTHADGANCLARALARHGGIAFWRSFVYRADVDPDRLKRAYLEFKPLDGQFDDNVFVQTKYGPLDFMPREPFHPLFGQMPQTKQCIELQITQEYTGQSTHLTYLAPIWEEILKSDTYVDGAGSYVGKVIDGTLHGHTDMTSMTGVSNIGSATNLTGHPFGQANWFAFGRMAWDWTLTSKSIADDWIRMTWSNDPYVVDTIKRMMMGSREALVNYQESLGLVHQQRQSDHYGPGPSEISTGSNPDWYARWYSRADSVGLGYDRSSNGSNFASLYAPELATMFNSMETCPENLLALFYHVPFTYTMKSGRTFWDELCRNYQIGVHYVTNMRAQWDSLQPYIDNARFTDVKNRLANHERDAGIWRDTCISYYGSWSQMPVPPDPLQLRNLMIDGNQIDGFEPGVYDYTVGGLTGDKIPQVSAVPNDPNATVTITQATGIPGQAVVKVYMEEPFFYGPEFILKDYPNTMLAVYTINFTDEVIPENFVVAIEAETAAENTENAYVRGVANGTYTWSLVDGQTTKAMQFLPDDGTLVTSGTDTDSLNAGSSLNYKINFPTGGTYYVWLLCKSRNYNTDSIHVGLDKEYKFTANGIQGKSNGQWRWVNISDGSDGIILGASTLEISAGVHELNFWGRESGLAIDRIYLTTDGSISEPTWPIAVTGITLDKSTLTLKKGSSETLTATVTPADATNKRVKFTSDNTEVATVSGLFYDAATGKTSVTVNAIAPGTATITATAVDGSNKTAICNVIEEDEEEYGYTVSTEFNMDKLVANKIVNAEVTATNANSSITDVLVIVALYEGDRMINVSYISKNIPVGASEKLTAGFMLPPVITDQHKLKVFVWDGETIGSSNGIPLSEIREL